MTKDHIYIKLISKLGKLFEEYRSCKCERVKERLVKDIRQLGEQLEET